MGSHFLLQGIFLTQGLSPGLLHCRQTLSTEPLGRPPQTVVIIYINNLLWWFSLLLVLVLFLLSRCFSKLNSHQVMNLYLPNIMIGSLYAFCPLIFTILTWSEYYHLCFIDGKLRYQEIKPSLFESIVLLSVYHNLLSLFIVKSSHSQDEASLRLKSPEWRPKQQKTLEILDMPYISVCVYLSYIDVYNNVSNTSLLKFFFNFVLPNSEDTLLAHPDKIGLMN